MEDFYGELHPITADWYDRLAYACEQNGELDKASQAYRRSLRTRSYSDENPLTPLSLFNLGVSLFKQGNIKEAHE